ncbi:hypothetical protein L1987_07102 [Smallanthus sonchifolius]|uniref:Uncharacterized protein n=1 Tax=Smallanthus sonchifolius TaxID=185202 RepID=A0ACB9K033_9ASTR|nr:hypothetical protein L1987_07102 [Smallanthus sonchifolius]
MKKLLILILQRPKVKQRDQKVKAGEQIQHSQSQKQPPQFENLQSPLHNPLATDDIDRILNTPPAPNVQDKGKDHVDDFDFPEYVPVDVDALQWRGNGGDGSNSGKDERNKKYDVNKIDDDDGGEGLDKALVIYEGS